MKSFAGKALRWNWDDGVVELTLDREPANEIGTAMLSDLEKFVAAFDALAPETCVCIISSAQKHGFSALACDIIVADKMARFAFPELRLGLIPGFGGIPRLKRDLGNGFVRDLLFTGRSVNATRAQAVGLVSQLVAEGEALNVARSNANQIKKFDPFARAAAKKFLKPIPHEELRREIDLFCELFTRPAVMAALKKFVESTDAMPYLP